MTAKTAIINLLLHEVFYAMVKAFLLVIDIVNFYLKSKSHSNDACCKWYLGATNVIQVNY